MKLHELHINNFKFFPKQDPKSPLLKIDGKNLLIYGENGSGKSTIYWAIYTLLENSLKTDLGEVHKYFRLNDPQSHRNIHAEDIADSFIELEDTQSHIMQTYKISETLVGTQVPGDSNIKDANQASDFIKHRLLLNFHNSAHSEEMSEDEKLAIIQSEFERLSNPNHPVRFAIETLNSLEEFRLIREVLK